MPKFKGQIRVMKELSNCPICNRKPVLRRDSTKRFQVWCDCGAHTEWQKKSSAIIDWYKLIVGLKDREIRKLQETAKT